MPKPKKGQSKDEWMQVCVPYLRKEGKKQKQAVGQCMGMWRQHKKEMSMNKRLEYFTVNVDFSQTRTEYLEGEEYYVAPVAMMTPGVHSGSNGSLLYLAKDLDVYSPAWNHKPIVLNHPRKGIACTQEYLNKNKMGLLLETRYERGKQRAEAWFHKKRTASVSPKTFNALKKREMMEVSTGLFVDAKKGPGNYHGKKYKAVARNHRPDHLAILPDSVGACSIKDGAGLFQLNSNRSRKKASRFVKRIVNRQFSRLSKRKLAKDRSTTNSHKKEKNMKKAEFVDKLIKNEMMGFDKKDRKWLMSLDSDQLKKLRPKKAAVVFATQEDFDETIRDRFEDFRAEELRRERRKLLKNKKVKTKKVNNHSDPDEDDDDDGGEEGETKSHRSTKNGKQVLNGKSRVKKLRDFLKNDVPAELRPILNQALQTAKKERAKYIKIITSNEDSPYTEEELKLKDNSELAKLAKLVQNSSKEDEDDDLVSFFGAEGPRSTKSVKNKANDDDEDGLDLPVLNQEGFARTGGLKNFFPVATASKKDEDDEDEDEMDDE